MRPQAFFLPAGSGSGEQRFCIFHPAKGGNIADPARGWVLYIHPFAEEINKSRRMAALQARALAQAGFSVLQIDLKGCGDSAGDFGDASWQDWVQDVMTGYQWLQNQANLDRTKTQALPLWLWGLRAGCLLAVEAARQLDVSCNFLFWQPPSTGKPLLQQFLRLKAAANMLAGEGKGALKSLRQQIAAGAPLEIAGYTLSAELARGLEGAALLPAACTEKTQRVEWFELSSQEHASLASASTDMIAQWHALNFAISSHVVQGPAFWQTLEMEDAPALVLATTAALTCGIT